MARGARSSTRRFVRFNLWVMLKCIPIPSIAALFEAYSRSRERHEHNKHCASQRSNSGGLDIRRRTTPFVFIPSPP